VNLMISTLRFMRPELTREVAYGCARRFVAHERRECPIDDDRMRRLTGEWPPIFDHPRKDLDEYGLPRPDDG
jgi:hypothetical protein